MQIKRVSSEVEEPIKKMLGRKSNYVSDVEVLLSSVLDLTKQLELCAADTLSTMNLSPNEFDVLRVAYDFMTSDEPEMLTKTKIIERIALHRNVAYRVIDSLVSAGWLEAAKKGREVELSLTGEGVLGYQKAFDLFYVQSMNEVLSKTSKLEISEIESCLKVLQTLRFGLDSVPERKLVTENTKKMSKQESSELDLRDERISFYAILYSEKNRVMALTGNNALLDLSEQELADSYRNWNQAKSKTESFRSLAQDEKGRCAIRFENELESVIAFKVIEFLENGYETGSRLPDFIRRRLD